MELLKNFAADEDGATAIEYGLIAALVAVAVVGALTGLGDSVSAAFNSIATTITQATN